MISVRFYGPDDQARWDDFVRQACNGHFMFCRPFMDYHSDRFTDASLIVEEEGAWLAILPANRVGDDLWSHQGLTFGGLVHGDALKTARCLKVFQAIAEFAAAENISVLHLKILPYIYHRRPAEEQVYALFRMGAELTRCDVTAVIQQSDRIPFSSRRRRGVKKAAKAELRYRQDDSLEGFYVVLAEVLQARHGTAPTHTLDELKLLKERFPEEIKVFTAVDQEKVVAGVLIFEHAKVAHCQYIASNDQGRNVGALDGLFHYLIHDVYPEKDYVDFGTSNRENGHVLNDTLINQKEEFGGRAVAHPCYTISFT